MLGSVTSCKSFAVKPECQFTGDGSRLLGFLGFSPAERYDLWSICISNVVFESAVGVAFLQA